MKQRKAASSRNEEAAPTEASTGAQATAAEKKSFPIVGIGASAGGLEAFKELLENLPWIRAWGSCWSNTWTLIMPAS